MKTTGIHHVSVLSTSVEKAYNFYHKLLGLKHSMKTVNQDDPLMWHLFFGDDLGREGTEFTVFQMNNSPINQFGTNAIERTYFLVPSVASLTFWIERFEQFNICHYGLEQYGNRTILRFEDEDGQRLGLVYHANINLDDMKPFNHPEIPIEHAILGIGEVHLRVRYHKATERQLIHFFGFEKIGTIEAMDRKVFQYRHANNPFQHEIHLIEDQTSPIQRLGTGGIHHLAFGVGEIGDLQHLELELEELGIFHSGIKNRDFMHSSYYREPNYNLFEIATPLTQKTEKTPEQFAQFSDIPIFLPDFLENRRQEIERQLLI